MQVTFDQTQERDPEPCPTWQELLPGFGPGADSLAEQQPLFDLGPKSQPAGRQDLPGQTRWFE